MDIRRAVAIVTGLVGLLAVISATSLLILGFPSSHWLMVHKVALAATALVGAVLLWKGARFSVATVCVAWVLAGVWAAPLALYYALKLGS